MDVACAAWNSNGEAMNERIRELMIQSMVEVAGHGDVQKTYQRFAELLIKECAKICDDIGKQARKDWKSKYDPLDDGRCNGAWECEETIKEHFGVDE